MYKPVCIKTSLCKSLCVKASVCKRVCVTAPHQQHASSYFLVCYLLVSSLQLSFGPRCRLVSICNVVSCRRMPRTCESIARSKIEHKQRTKCCNLQHFALSDGKNPRKYHSFTPRKWLKHCYLQGFAHVTILDLKTRKYQQFFFAFIKASNRFKKCNKLCNLQGFGTVTGKNCVNTSVSASKS